MRRFCGAWARVFFFAIMGTVMGEIFHPKDLPEDRVIALHFSSPIATFFNQS
jgi:hypothetical protein